MKSVLVAAAVLFQVLVLAIMAGEREWVLRNGRTIRVRTAPIDPNDPMRGEYLRLDYDISQVPRSLWRDHLPARLSADANANRRSRDLRVYASLKVGENGLAEVESLSDREPAGGLYLRGRLDESNGQADTVRVRYGIEALFMEQGKAKQMEDMQRKERPGVPLSMEVAVGGTGIAVLKGYEWEPLGITLSFDRPLGPPVPTGPGTVRQVRTGTTTAINVELKNYGPGEIAIVDLPEGGSLRLVPNDRLWQAVPYRWVGENVPPPAPTAGKVIVLQPGKSHRMKIDLTLPRWFVTDTKAAAGTPAPKSLRDFADDWAASFRVEYAPPPKASLTGLPHADLVRPGPLRSRAFTPGTGVD